MTRIMSVIIVCIELFSQIILSMTCVKDTVFFPINFVYNTAPVHSGQLKQLPHIPSFCFPVDSVNSSFKFYICESLILVKNDS